MTRRERPLRRRCTTGACATAAAKAYTALVRSDFPDPVGITRPRGGRSTFAPAAAEGIALGDRIAEAAQLTATQLTAVRLLAGSAVVVDLAIFDREQNLVGCAPFKR